MLAGEIQNALSRLNELAQNGKDLGRLLSDLLNHFRNLLIFQVSRGDLNLLEVSEAEAAALKEQSAARQHGALTRILEVLADAEMRLRDAASKKILMEVTLLKAIEARSAVSLDSVLKQLNQLRGQTGTGGTPAPSNRGRSGCGTQRPARREPASRHNTPGRKPRSDPVPATVPRLRRSPPT